MTRLALAAALTALLALAACGDSDDEETTTAAEATTTAATTEAETTTTTAAETTTTTAADAGPCSPIEELEVPNFGEHEQREFTLADYETNPPTGGDHASTPLEPGRAYDEKTPLGGAVHLLEHGAVIGWTNDLSGADERAITKQFEAAFDEGYYQLATVELPELEVPFALSAWGALQTCEEVDASVIQPFIEEWYASPKSGESPLACQGSARRLPPC